jgi:hypothetical protein
VIVNPKLHYFDDPQADPNDIWLTLAIQQGYVPDTCLLAGRVVMQEVNQGNDPCAGCAGPRPRCHGRPETAGELPPAAKPPDPPPTLPSGPTPYYLARRKLCPKLEEF